MPKIIKINKTDYDLGIIARSRTPGPEIEMVDYYITCRESRFCTFESDRELAVFQEIKIGNTYPDIIFAEYDRNAFTSWNDSRCKLTTDDIKLWHYLLVMKKAASNEIVEDLHWPYKQVLFSLEALYDANIVSRVCGKWTTEDEAGMSRYGIRRLEAIEAKVNNWNLLYRQALYNTIFAMESSVLYMTKKMVSLQHIAEAESQGLGVYIYDGTHFSHLVSATSKAYPAHWQSLLLNEYIGRMLYYGK